VTLHLKQTTQVVELYDEKTGLVVPARIWEGTTGKGVPVVAFITRVAVRNNQDTAEFDRELQEQCEPSMETAMNFPLRMIL